MEALGALNPLEVVEAGIQKKIGRFLSLKSELIKLTRHGSLTIQEETAGLLVQQRRLESKLTETLSKIEQLKSGAWSFGNVFEVSSFSVDLVTQINKVGKLKQKAQTMAGTIVPETGLPFTIQEVPIWVWGVGAFLLWRMIR
jgi:hypothetical protein